MVGWTGYYSFVSSVSSVGRITDERTQVVLSQASNVTVDFGDLG